ncbi:uncharacterized protein LOC105281994 isoform X2 [Ooceraea biroi]|nr:uncharacterized protein LOC105281994 isoform X2 [Ooceraea biroi]
MENEGYEEDQSRTEGEQSTLENSNHQLHASTIEADASIVTVTHSDGHVYEDISTNTEKTLELSETPFSDKSQSIHETKDLRLPDATKRAWISRPSSIASPTIDRYFRNDSTLPSSAGISANRESPVSSSLTASKDDPARLSKNSCDFRRDVLENVSLESSREDSTRDASVQSDRRPNRRRRKKDCKHCRSKLSSASSCEKLNELADGRDAILRENASKHPDKEFDVTNLLFREPFLHSQNLKIYPIVNRASLRDIGAKKGFPAFSENRLGNAAGTSPNAIDDGILGQVAESNQTKMYQESNGVLINGIDMRVNSIYSQDRWYGKELPVFYTGVKDQNNFQRAYSLPAWTHSPTSQNRANLRRSVRNDPAPHPARLDKHRRGWTLHLVRPLKASGWSKPLIPLLIIVLALLGVAGVALYIVFEPEKIQIIQQYLKSSTSKLTGENFVDDTSAESITSVIPNDEPSLASTEAISTSTMARMNVDTFTVGALLNSESSFPESTSLPTATEAETASQDANATRYCDDCFEGEVCVALVSEKVPTCRNPHDREDPTGCAGFCVVNKQKCHRLDVDAFRCVEIEHHCLDDEWTCSNTLCIPLEKHCDGHMNCYDHTDEYDCVCNLETHFHCGNKTSCLPLEKRCDGKIDCWDAADEINCTLICPLDSEFTCSNGECILKARFCDGLSDCSDGSDEPHGCKGRCNKHEFTCQNGRCIMKNLKCNGIDDCGDGTDEEHCKNRFT